MKPEHLRDYVNDKTESLFDSVTARWIAWVIMAFAAGYFISSFLWHIFL